MTIDLGQYRKNKTTVFTGRPQGVDVRTLLNLESIDKSNEDVTITIPEDTTSLNPSFFLGLLYDSIKKLGLEKFKSKYHFEIKAEDPELREAIQSNISDGYRNALNSLNQRTGLNSTF